MNGSQSLQMAGRIPGAGRGISLKSGVVRWAVAGVLAAALSGAPGMAQITIDTHTGAVTNGASGPQATIDRRYQQITPTHVALNKTELDPKTRQELIRIMQSEQGFAMRPFPRGHKGLTLEANGKLQPAGEAYLNMVVSRECRPSRATGWC